MQILTCQDIPGVNNRNDFVDAKATLLITAQGQANIKRGAQALMRSPIDDELCLSRLH
jgi:hypothetical protein